MNPKKHIYKKYFVNYKFQILFVHLKISHSLNIKDYLELFIHLFNFKLNFSISHSTFS